MSALSAERLTARYPGMSAPALADLDLELRQGERLLLLGPNGAGKSTFIAVFAGLLRAAQGKALIGGQPPREAREQVGVVSHATYLYDELTTAENLYFYAQLYLVEDPVGRARQLLEQLGIAHLADAPVGRLSRGQQQRVAIARALLHDPSVLLLDEPDTGLDAGGFARVEELATTAERTAVVTTHNLATGLRLATRVAVLARGRLVHQQPRADVADAPALSELLTGLAQA